MSTPQAEAGAVVRQRAKVLAALAAAALLGHVGLLGGLQGMGGAGEAPVHVAALSVRTLPPVEAPPASLPPEQERAAAAARAAPIVPVAVRPARGRAAPLALDRAAPAPAVEVAVALAEPASAPQALVPAVAPVPEAAASQSGDTVVVATAAPAAAAEPAAPVYRTRFPPALLLRYELRRGLLRGSGDLQWRPDGEHYELRLDGRVAGLSVLSQVSQGGFDAAGLAPVRFTDQRLRRERVAANFQREAGKLGYSGVAAEFPLQPGVQDRLSWMMQLAAIVAADAAMHEPEIHVDMPVTGARGDLSLWVFRGLGVETVETPAGAVPALRFTREPRGPYDTRVDVWLDPARHGLPLKASMRNGGDGETIELLLQDVGPLP